MLLLKLITHDAPIEAKVMCQSANSQKLWFMKSLKTLVLHPIWQKTILQNGEGMGSGVSLLAISVTLGS